MMDIKYVNHKGAEIDLTKHPFMLQGEDLFNYEWEYSATNTGTLGGYINKFYRDVSEFSMDVLIHADTRAELQKSMNDFFSLVEQDIIARKPGRLVVSDGTKGKEEELYMICYMITSKKSMWRSGTRNAVLGLKVVTEYPFWCKEVMFKYYLSREDADNKGGFNYPYEFPYDYKIGNPSQYLMNKFYTDCNFEMTIYGEVTTPKVKIGENLYKVYTHIGTYDQLKINSRDKTVKLHKANGQVINVFNERSREEYIFTKIPVERSLIEANTFFDLTIYQERSEPEWILL